MTAMQRTFRARGGLPWWYWRHLSNRLYGLKYVAETDALLGRMAPQTATRRARINALVTALKTAGVWTKLDALYVLAAADAQSAKLNWIADQYNLLEGNGPAFTVDRGYAFNGTSSYLNTTFNPLAAVAPKFVKDSGHQGAWHLTNLNNAGAPSYDIGLGASRIINQIALITQLRPNNGTSVSVAGVYDAHKVWSRSAAALWEYYNNGADVGGGIQASTALSNGVFGIGRCAAAAEFGVNQCAVCHFGSNLTAVEVAAAYTALRAYLQAVGAVV